jgi:hypothetical protein
MDRPFEVAPDIYVLPSFVAIPAVGYLPVNAFLFAGDEPVLVDTGFHAESEQFLDALASLIDIGRIKHLLISHDDGDHTGSLGRILDLAPDAEVLTHGLAALRMRFTLEIPLDRVHAIVPGDEIRAGEWNFRVFRPPLFDNPTSLGLYESHAAVMFPVDCFGGLVPRPAERAEEYPPEDLARSIMMWGSFDDPWVQHYDRGAYTEMLDEVRAMPADVVLSSHLPPATGIFDRLVAGITALPDAAPFVPPNQAAFAQMVSAMLAPTG